MTEPIDCQKAFTAIELAMEPLEARRQDGTITEDVAKILDALAEGGKVLPALARPSGGRSQNDRFPNTLLAAWQPSDGLSRRLQRKLHGQLPVNGLLERIAHCPIGDSPADAPERNLRSSNDWFAGVSFDWGRRVPAQAFRHRSDPDV